MVNIFCSLLCVVLVFLTILSGCGEKKVFIQIKGSDTMVDLAQCLAERYMEKERNISISVTGGGSGVGISALIDKKTDIANSSRSMKDEEIEMAKKKGIDPVEIVIAIDGLALIVHPELPIESLTLDEIGQIYRGEITHWKEVGGPDLEISLYGRTSASGTYEYFREEVVKGEYSLNMKSMVGNSHIIEAIKRDKGGIGYVGIGCIVDKEGKVMAGIKPVNIRKEKEVVSPLDMEDVELGVYPLARPLYQYIVGRPKKEILEFIQFVLSEQGQKIVSETGFYPVSGRYVEANRKVLKMVEQG